MRKHNKAAYKSGLEKKFQEASKDLGWVLPYEQDKIKYTVPEKVHTYTPDFTVTKNIYIETKGLWTAADRKKALLIKEQYPDIRILYVFQRDQKLSKKSNTTYLEWAEKQGLDACLFVDEKTWATFIMNNIPQLKGFQQ
jgi:hypothetical protein